MAKLTRSGDAFTITSALKLEDIQKVAKYNDKALALFGGEEGKDMIFKIGTCCKGSGSVSKFGIEFARATEEGYAYVTTVLPVPQTDFKGYVADNYGAAVKHLIELEASIPDAIKTIDADRKAVMDLIHEA